MVVTVPGRSRIFALRPIVLDAEAHFRERCGDDHEGAAAVERELAAALERQL